MGAVGRRRRGLRAGYFAGCLLRSFRSTPDVGVAIRRGSFWALGWLWALGRWALGGRQGHPRGVGSARSLYGDFDGSF